MLRCDIQRANHACNYCQRTFTTASGVRRHIAHSMQCQEQWQTDVQHARHAPGGQHPEHGMEDIVEEVDLPYEDNNAPIGDADGAAVPHEGERDVHFNALNGDADGAGEPHEDEHEDVHMVEDGEGDHFPRFTEEFAAHAVADVLG